MAKIARDDAFDRPFEVDSVDGEVLTHTDQAAVDLALTPDSATETGRRLIKVARAARKSEKSTRA
ncbi:MAG: hypothetical protein ABI906_09135 [Pseudomonadota bacterium]